MKAINFSRFIFLTLLLGIFSCNQGAAPTGEPTDTKSPPPEISQPAPDATTGRDYQKRQVKGCDGGSGSATAAKNALAGKDFAGCNREASCAFNSSLQGEGSQGDPEAAFYGALCKLALTVESPQMEILAMEPLRASDYFGQANGFVSLMEKLEQKWTENGLATFGGYLELQAGQGRDVETLFQTAVDLVIENFFDIHIMARTLANAPQFKANIPQDFMSLDPSVTPDLQDWSALQMGLVDFWAMNILTVAEVFKIYRLGIDSPDSFINEAQIINDMNTEKKFLSLRSPNPDTTSLKSALIAWSEAAVQAGGNFGLHWNSSTHTFDIPQWIKDSDLFPLHDEAEPFALGVLAAQLRRSLNNELVWLAAADNKSAFNLGGLLKSLPDMDKIPGGPLVFTLPDDIELDPIVMKAFFGPNFAEQ